ncbi:hypothetical protein ACFLVX_03145 [Chloroflexota bacterium]
MGPGQAQAVREAAKEVEIKAPHNHHQPVRLPQELRFRWDRAGLDEGRTTNIF